MKRFAVTIVCALVLAACGYSESEYVGRWVNVNNAKDIILITQNGGSLLVAASEPSTSTTGGIETFKFPAAVENGQLVVKASETETYVIDQSTGHLTSGTAGEYKRLAK